MAKIKPEELVTLKQLCEKLGKSKHTIWRKIRTGKIPACAIFETTTEDKMFHLPTILQIN